MKCRKCGAPDTTEGPFCERCEAFLARMSFITYATWFIGKMLGPTNDERLMQMTGESLIK